MEQKKIDLEELFEKIREVANKYETEEDEPETLVLEGKNIASFADELIRSVEDYVQQELLIEQVEEEEETFFFGYDDDLD